MAVKLGSTESVAEAELCWDKYWFLMDRSVSLSSWSEAVEEMAGSGGEGAMVMEAGRAVVENQEVDSWVITSRLSFPLRPL